jgi:hypothetical protein
MLLNITDKFIEDLYSLSKSDFPEIVLTQAKDAYRLQIGVTLAGSKMQKEKGREKLLNYSDFLGVSTIIYKTKNLLRKIHIYKWS